MIAPNALKKILNWLKGPNNELFLYGPNQEHWCFLYNQFLESSEQNELKPNQVIICPDEDMAEDVYQLFREHNKNFNVYFFPGLEQGLYGPRLYESATLFKRFHVLENILNDKQNKIIICSIESFLYKNPPKTLFLENNVNIKVSDIYELEDLKKKLVEIGYRHVSVIESPGEFSHKGEILDIFPVSTSPVRIHFFDEMIEEIFKIEISTQKTLREFPVDNLRIGPTPLICLNQNFTQQLRKQLPVPAPTYKSKFEARKELFAQLAQNEPGDLFTQVFLLFFEQTITTQEYLDDSRTLYTLLMGDNILDNESSMLEDFRVEFEQAQEDKDSDCIIPHWKYFYQNDIKSILKECKTISISSIDLSSHFNEDLDNTLHLNIESSTAYFSRNLPQGHDRYEYINSVFSLIKDEYKFSGEIYICCKGKKEEDEIKYLLSSHKFSLELTNRVHYIQYQLRSGFLYNNEKTLILSDSDLFSYKVKKTKKTYKKTIDPFAEQMSTLKVGDYIVHQIHGIGRYEGLKSLNFGKTPSDFLVLTYEDQDKVYVPVYKMHLLQKFASAETPTKISNLKTNKFEQAKSKAKKSAKELAFDLIKLQAKRETSHAFACSPSDHHFKEFELAFTFQETHDQLTAIDQVITDMENDRPMDRLVCGDVGFGKTEVAMRASYKAVLDKKQVAILVPTTILAFQHFHSFQKRFKNFPVNIDFLSRFKSTKESKEIKEKLANGQIDIIIGTHKLLSKDIRFRDLGLVIVDEEQRFGVAHKEKLKLIRENAHFLTLTATPIPRTLQFSLLGLKDLSLIQTAPPKRQSIKTYIIKEDFKTIQEAIKKELGRNGQVFFVHNRVKDIELVAAEVQKMAPEARIIVGHGQLTERDLEKRMANFYNQKADILVCTTIIETGLDIPNANTMIINRAHTFGLSQLHQLRGRIGRSEKKAYSYFIVPRDSSLREIAQKRLKALQTYTKVGQGFALAASDLELRGAGNLLGAQQSGHVESVGLELYMELLKESIAELKGQKTDPKRDIEIQLPWSAYIPDDFITDSGVRLKYYKKLSNCNDNEQLESIKEEVKDIYGNLPIELNGLIITLKIRQIFQNCAVVYFKLTLTQIFLKFDKAIINKLPALQNNIVKTFMSRPKIYKMNPDYSVTIKLKNELSEVELLDTCHNLAQLITNGLNL